MDYFGRLEYGLQERLVRRRRTHLFRAVRRPPVVAGIIRAMSTPSRRSPRRRRYRRAAVRRREAGGRCRSPSGMDRRPPRSDHVEVVRRNPSWYSNLPPSLDKVS